MSMYAIPQYKSQAKNLPYVVNALVSVERSVIIPQVRIANTMGVYYSHLGAIIQIVHLCSVGYSWSRTKCLI